LSTWISPKSDPQLSLTLEQPPSSSGRHLSEHACQQDDAQGRRPTLSKQRCPQVLILGRHPHIRTLFGIIPHASAFSRKPFSVSMSPAFKPVPKWAIRTSAWRISSCGKRRFPLFRSASTPAREPSPPGAHAALVRGIGFQTSSVDGIDHKFRLSSTVRLSIPTYRQLQSFSFGDL